VVLEVGDFQYAFGSLSGIRFSQCTHCFTQWPHLSALSVSSALATAFHHVVGMEQAHVAHAYHRERQLNLLHPADQAPGQVQIARHECLQVYASQ